MIVVGFLSYIFSNKISYVLNYILGNGILSIESYDIKKDQWSKLTSTPGMHSKTWPQRYKPLLYIKPLY